MLERHLLAESSERSWGYALAKQVRETHKGDSDFFLVCALQILQVDSRLTFVN